MKPERTPIEGVLESVLADLARASRAATAAAKKSGDYARIDLATGVTLALATAYELAPGIECEASGPEDEAPEVETLAALSDVEATLHQVPLTSNPSIGGLVVDVADLVREAKALVQP